VRLAAVELPDLDLADRVVAVRVRALDDAREGAALLDAPGDQQRAGALERDAGAWRVVAQQPVTAADEPRLERARFRVETGVQESRVGLAGSGADVGTGLQQRTAQLEATELARDRGADDPGADYGDVPVGCAYVSLRASPRVATLRRPPARAPRPP
jgi:hypothetical protein